MAASVRAISVDAMNPFGRPSARSLKMLGVDGVRMVAFNDPLWFVYYREMELAGLGVAVVYTGQSFDLTQPIGPQCAHYAAAVNPSFHILGNEWNVDIDATWPPGGDDAFVAFWNEAAPQVRSVQPGAKLYVGGLFSEPDPSAHLVKVWSRLSPRPDGIDYHPYLETYDESRAVLAALRNDFRCEISAMEWNDSNPAGIARFQRILGGTTDHSAWFCYDDRMVMDHGVIDAKGKRKPTWTALKEAYRRG